MKIIALKTSYEWGYVEGDLLEVEDTRGSNIYAKNLTRPWLYHDRSKLSILMIPEFKIYNPSEHYECVVDSCVVTKFLGIPIIKKTKMKKVPKHLLIGGN